MANKSRKKSANDNLICDNRRARHDFFIEETFEAGLELMGWEVKALRAGQAQIGESYVFVKNGEAWLSNAQIQALGTASTHVRAEPTRVRKLLLHRNEIDRFVGAVDRKGYTLVPLNLHWTRGRVKLTIGLGKGKKQHDKRADKKDKDWARQKDRILKRSGR